MKMKIIGIGMTGPIQILGRKTFGQLDPGKIDIGDFHRVRREPRPFSLPSTSASMASTEHGEAGSRRREAEGVSVMTRACRPWDELGNPLEDQDIA